MVRAMATGGKTPLALAREKKHAAVVELLRKHGGVE